MGFSTEGDLLVKITGVRAAASRFNSPAPAIDIVFELETKDGQVDQYAVELSPEIIDRGRNAGKSRAQALAENLAQLGYTGRLLVSEMNAGMAGTICEAHVAPREYNGNTYYDVKWLNKRGGRSETIDTAAADAHVAAMLGYQLAPVAAVAAPAVAPVTQPAAPVAAAAVVAPSDVAAAPAVRPVVDPWE